MLHPPEQLVEPTAIQDILAFIPDGSKILLINPPVYDRRYEWLRWNQPTDLLRLSSYLKREKSCEVKLFDFMQPDEKGQVLRKLVKGSVLVPALASEEIVIDGVVSGSSSQDLEIYNLSESDIDPNSAAQVVEEIGAVRPVLQTSQERFLRWHFGKPFAEFEDFLNDPETYWFSKSSKTLSSSGSGKTRPKPASKRVWRPDFIWITSLTSYWWEPIDDLLSHIRNRLKTRIIMAGNYPFYETQHAKSRPLLSLTNEGDTIIDQPLALYAEAADFSLYSRYPQFCALDGRNSNLYDEIKNKLNLGVRHFAFFNDPLTSAPFFKKNVVPALEKLLSESEQDVLFDIPKVRKKFNNSLVCHFHGICGIYPGDLTDPAVGQLLRRAGFNEFHFEYEVDEQTGRVKLESYRKALEVLRIDRQVVDSWELSAFVNIGDFNDRIEVIIQNMLDLLRVVPSIIPKPWSPDPHSGFQHDSPEKLSPHLMPLAGYNGIAQEDYSDLYRLAAFLNYKVRSRTLDYTSDSYLVECIRQAFNDKLWHF